MDALEGLLAALEARRMLAKIADAAWLGRTMLAIGAIKSPISTITNLRVKRLVSGSL
jgi:hypothetical protein